MRHVFHTRNEPPPRTTAVNHSNAQNCRESHTPSHAHQTPRDPDLTHVFRTGLALKSHWLRTHPGKIRSPEAHMMTGMSCVALVPLPCFCTYASFVLQYPGVDSNMNNRITTLRHFEGGQPSPDSWGITGNSDTWGSKLGESL